MPKTYVAIANHIKDINWITTLISSVCIIFLVLGKELNVRFKSKLPFPLPWEVVLVICGTILGKFLQGETTKILLERFQRMKNSVIYTLYLFQVILE